MTSSALQLIYCVGISHKTAPLALREKLASTSSQPADLHFLSPEGLLEEFVDLCTCNRQEMYLVARRELSPVELSQIFCNWLKLKNGCQLDSAAQILSHTYQLVGIAAVRHVLRVCASLDSMIVGETQISGQFKESVLRASSAKTLGPYLSRLCQEALSCSKKIRTATGIGRKTVSISHTAVDLARRFFQNLSEQNFLFLGSGTMIELAARYACDLGAKQILILNRTLDRATQLVRALGAGQALALDELEARLESAQVVVTASGAGQVISYEMLKRVCSKRRGAMLCIADIAVPRNVDPRCRDLSGVYLFELDDLQKVVEGNRSEREKEALQAESFVDSAALRFSQWLAALSLSPVIGGFHDYLKELMEREMAKTLRKAAFHGSKEREAVLDLLESVRRKVVSDAARSIYGQSDDLFRNQLAVALGEMFGRTEAESFARDVMRKDREENVRWQI